MPLINKTLILMKAIMQVIDESFDEPEDYKPDQLIRPHKHGLISQIAKRVRPIDTSCMGCKSNFF